MKANINPNEATLLYVLQNDFGHFSKSYSLEKAQKTFKKLIKGYGPKYKAKHLAVYLMLKPMTEIEAYSSSVVELGWMHMTHCNDNVILLNQTTLL